MIECTVRSRVDQASLWKTITMLVEGSSFGYVFFLHLQHEDREQARKRMRCKQFIREGGQLTAPFGHREVTDSGLFCHSLIN